MMIGFTGILGLFRDNGKEKQNYNSRFGFYRDSGKYNGNSLVYYSILGLHRDNGTRKWKLLKSKLASSLVWRRLGQRTAGVPFRFCISYCHGVLQVKIQFPDVGP